MLLDNLKLGGGTGDNGHIILEKGSLNTNSKSIDVAYFRSSGSKARIVNLGSSEITTRYSLYGWQYVGSNKTLSAGTSHRKLGGVYNTDLSAFGFNGVAGDDYYNITFTNSSSVLAPFSGGVFAKKLTVDGNAYFKNSNTFDTLVFVNGGKYFFKMPAIQTVNKGFYPSGSPCVSTELADLGSGAVPRVVVLNGNIDYEFIISKNINATGSNVAWNLGPLSTNLGGNTFMTFDPSSGSSALDGLGSDLFNLPCVYSTILNTSGFYPNPSTTFVWNTGATTDTIGVSSFGTYSISVSYAPTCVVSDAVALSPHDSCSSFLPVVLQDFIIQNNNCSNIISWSTSSEINNAFFEIHRSKDAVNWELVHEQIGAGNSNELLTYLFIDNTILGNGTYYYYLKQVDYNGRSDAFPVKLVDVKSCNNTVAIFPNPVSDMLNVKWDNTQTNITNYQVIDIAGRVLLNNTQVNNSGIEAVNVSAFSEGSYMLLLGNKEGVVSNEKFIVVR